MPLIGTRVTPGCMVYLGGWVDGPTMDSQHLRVRIIARWEPMWLTVATLWRRIIRRVYALESIYRASMRR